MKRQANSHQKLITPPRANRNNDEDDARDETRPRRSGSSSSSSSSDVSVESSCVLSEAKGTADDNPQNTEEEMALVGCPRCHMYVMLSEVDSKCPKCKSTVLSLDFLKEEEINYGKKN